jgi:hypothetical protein
MSLVVSEKRLRANRLNALKSTGPRTAEGKARSSRNALKHGMFTRKLLLPGESQVELRELHLALLEEYKPKTVSQQFLVERVLAGMWRMRRMSGAETALYLLHHKWLSKNKPDAEREPMQGDRDGAGLLAGIMIKQDAGLVSLHRYEKRLEGTIHRAMRE